MRLRRVHPMRMQYHLRMRRALVTCIVSLLASACYEGSSEPPRFVPPECAGVECECPDDGSDDSVVRVCDQDGTRHCSQSLWYMKWHCDGSKYVEVSDGVYSCECIDPESRLDPGTTSGGSSSTGSTSDADELESSPSYDDV